MSADRPRSLSVRSGWLAALGAVAAATVLGAALGAVPARAASALVVSAAWVSEVTVTSARLSGEIQLDPGQQTTWHFEFLPARSYEANLAAGRAPFSNATRRPLSEERVPAGQARASVTVRVTGLERAAPYRYRLVAGNASGGAESTANLLTTQSLGGELVLPDGRGWELVSPPRKNGGQVDAPGEDAGGGVLQAAAGGDSVTYSSSVSFEGGEGSPPGNQYVGRRGSGSWSTQNVTTPTVSGAYDTETGGTPYQLFSADLSRALLSNGRRCREAGLVCPVANPPLPGSGAPAGYRNYYLRDNSANSFGALLGAGPLGQSSLSSSHFEVGLAGVSPDLRNVVLSSCAKLTAAATEVPLGEGCDEGQPNLYEWSEGRLALLNLLPGQATGTPGAALAAPVAAVSADGERVYFELGGALYLRRGSSTVAVAPAGTFQTAAADGSIAFYTEAGHLFRYSATSGAVTDLTPAGGVVGAIGASADGSRIYYLTAAGLFLAGPGGAQQVLSGDGAQLGAGDYPPASATARVSADGRRLVFLSREPLTDYDNVSLASGEPVSEVFLYEVGKGLRCLSCNPTGARPLGPSSIPGSVANGTALDAYRPRVLSDSGARLFFDSDDSLVPQDSNRSGDVYEWEAAGAGSCTDPAGCLSLVSSGNSAHAASFADASADGDDVFFRTDRSLVLADPGSYDLYDARVGGGFPIAPPPLPCEGDACQVLPSEPVDPALNTLNSGAGNPPLRFFDTNRHKPRYHRLRGHRHPGAARHKGHRAGRGKRGRAGRQRLHRRGRARR